MRVLVTVATMGFWTSKQQKRLGLEKSLLEKYFSGRIRWINETSPGEAKVEVSMTTNANKSYTLRVQIPADFPNSVPILLVTKPSRPLRKKDGGSLGFEDHSWGTHDGFTQICHYKPCLWSAENTLYEIFMKGLIWLEAYDAHLSTGKPIRNFLRKM